MLNLRFTLQVLLIVLTGTFLLVVGTPSLVAGLLFPLEREVQSLRVAVEGIFTEKSTIAVNTISENSVAPGVLNYFRQKWRSEHPMQDRKALRQPVQYSVAKPDPTNAKKALEAGAKGLGRPFFGLSSLIPTETFSYRTARRWVCPTILLVFLQRVMPCED